MVHFCIYESSGHMQCDFFFPLHNSMLSKGCIQVHVPSATNILTFRTTSFCGLRQAAFSALWLSPLLQTQNNNACHCWTLQGFLFRCAIQICSLRPYKGSLQPIPNRSAADLALPSWLIALDWETENTDKFCLGYFNAGAFGLVYLQVYLIYFVLLET